MLIKDMTTEDLINKLGDLAYPGFSTLDLSTLDEEELLAYQSLRNELRETATKIKSKR